MVAKPDKTQYKAKQVESDPEVDNETVEEITEFLETFFNLYPTALEKELEYYVESDAIQPINGNLKFVELVNPVYQKKGEAIQVKVIVKYLDNTAKVVDSFQYFLTLEKEENWKIINDK